MSTYNNVLWNTQLNISKYQKNWEQISLYENNLSSMIINCGFCYSQILDLNDYDILNGTSVRKVFLKSKFKRRTWFYSRFHKPFWPCTGLSVNRLLKIISQSPYCEYFWYNFIIWVNCPNCMLIDAHLRSIVVEVLIKVFYPIFFLN